jgi:gas vesicle protein
MESENGQVATSLGWFVLGAALGAGVAILLAPERGVKTRRRLVKQAEQGRKNILSTSQDIFERGRELFERGREIAQEASEMFERGRVVAERKFEENL